MKKFDLVILLILTLVISACSALDGSTGSDLLTDSPNNEAPTSNQVEETLENIDDSTATSNPPNENTQPAETTRTPTITPTPDPLGNLYDCQMKLEFTSGPLASQSTNFTVLGEDYFTDKGDKFEMGKGTGIYYEPQRYFILHSSYIREIIDRPLEAEFIRKYLESWGQAGPQTIQANIDALIGSQAIWKCEGGSSFTTEINGVVRLSHEASNRLWLEPLTIPDILADREGLVSEWVGGIEIEDESRFLLGFCGWGPESLGEERYTYYRYLVSFDVLDIYR